MQLQNCLYFLLCTVRYIFFGTKVISRFIGLIYENIAKMATVHTVKLLSWINEIIRTELSSPSGSELEMFHCIKNFQHIIQYKSQGE